jgi:hypothetical protein
MLNSHVEGQNRDAFYRFSRLFYEIGIFQRFKKGHTKEVKGPHAARGPQVAHGCIRVSLTQNDSVLPENRRNLICEKHNYRRKFTKISTFLKIQFGERT